MIVPANLRQLFNLLRERGVLPGSRPVAVDALVDAIRRNTLWRIARFESDEAYRRGGSPFDIALFEGNLLLNEGIAALENLLVGDAETAFSNANSYLGVGDSATAAQATDTGLIATTNELYKAMEATYPTKGNPTTWRSAFGSSEANFAWNEFTVANGNSDAADNLNRKVSAQGTKTAGQTWTLDLQITWS